MVVERVFKGLGHGPVVPLFDGDVSEVDEVSELAVRAVAGGLDHYVEGFLLVDAAYPFEDRVHDDGDGMIAYHHVCLRGPHVPDGHAPVLQPEFKQRTRHVPGPFRVDDCIEGMCGAVCVPGREGGIVGPSVCLVDFSVRAGIGAVGVAIYGGRDERMVEGGVESPAQARVVCMEAYASELVVPCFSGSGLGAVEVRCRRFRVKVGQGRLLACRRQGGGHGDLLSVVGRGEKECGGLAGAEPSAVFHDCHGVGDDFGERTRETAREPYFLAARPSVGEPVSGYGHGVYYLNAAVGGSVPVHRFREVENHGRRVGLGKRIALKPDARSGCQLDADSVVVEKHLVISGACRFGGVGELGVSAERFIGGFRRKGDGKERYVVEVACTGAA